MTILRSLVMALSCFSRIPVPQIKWEEASMRYMMCFFPVIGICIGLLCWLWCLLVDILQLNALIQAAGITLIPIAVSGGIHLDGFADCIDAQASHAAPAKKREILKDPHSGAFAIIGVVTYILAFFSFASEFQANEQCLLLLGCIFILSRCLSGIATLSFPASSESEMLASFHDSARKQASIIALAIIFIACSAIMIWIQPLIACIMIGCGALCLIATYVFAKTQFDGMSGDIAGAFLQMAELIMLICLVVGWKVLIP